MTLNIFYILFGPLTAKLQYPQRPPESLGKHFGNVVRGSNCTINPLPTWIKSIPFDLHGVDHYFVPKYYPVYEGCVTPSQYFFHVSYFKDRQTGGKSLELDIVAVSHWTAAPHLALEILVNNVWKMALRCSSNLLLLH